LTKFPLRIAALVLLAALLATNLYRAATQSIVHDEALTWQIYLTGPASTIFQYYDANNHFLATILFRISTALFGVSEFSLRLPTLLAGAWLFWTVFRLTTLIFGNGWLSLIGCAVLTLNPILLDFLVAARGYGLAIAGLFWALFQMLLWFQERSASVADGQLRKRLWKAALGCAIAVAANLTFLFPTFVLAVAFCVLIRRAANATAVDDAPARALQSNTRKKQKKVKPDVPRTKAAGPLVHFLVPVIVLALVYLLAAPIELARTQDFYVGANTALASLRNLAEVSFAYRNSSILQAAQPAWMNMALIILPLATVASLIAAGRLLRKGNPPTPLGLATILASISVIGSALLLAAAHLLSGIPYPIDRTGIYFVPLALLSALGLARILLDRRDTLRWAGWAIVLVLVLFIGVFAAEWNVSSFYVWRYDADSKRIFEAIESSPRPAGQVRLGVSWVLEPALNFYREERMATWMAPVERDGFEGSRQFYVATREDRRKAGWSNLKQIYRGPVSGTAVAVPRSQ